MDTLSWASSHFLRDVPIYLQFSEVQKTWAHSETHFACFKWCSSIMRSIVQCKRTSVSQRLCRQTHTVWLIWIWLYMLYGLRQCGSLWVTVWTRLLWLNSHILLSHGLFSKPLLSGSQVTVSYKPWLTNYSISAIYLFKFIVATQLQWTLRLYQMSISLFLDVNLNPKWVL